jgi:hypothetical protein
MDYKAVLTAEQRARGTLLKLDDLELVVNQQWRQISSVDESNSGGTEVSLSAVNGAKIVCFKCGKEGHKASNCPKNGKGGGKGFTKGGAKGQKDKGKCYQCRKVGPIAPNCWEDSTKADKRPANWKSVGQGGSG